MKTFESSEGFNVPICDFCESSPGRYSDVDWVEPIGNKGICSDCVKQLKELLK